MVQRNVFHIKIELSLAPGIPGYTQYDLTSSIVRLESPHQQFDPENSKCLDMFDENNPLNPHLAGSMLDGLWELAQPQFY